MMKTKSTTKVTASLHCGSSFQTATLSARPSSMPPIAAPLSEPDVLADVENRVRNVAMKEAVDEWLQGLRAKHHLQLDR